MNLKSIEYFLITAEEMNITRASERLYISQQALSSHIKRLEEEYHVQLFTRKPSLRLTPEGKQMVFYGKLLLDSEAKMRAAFSDISKNCHGTLKIGCPRLRSDVFFPLIWKYYHPSHPNIYIELINGNANELNDLLQTGKIDLYIGMDIPPEPTQELIELAKEKVQCCFSEELLRQYYPDTWSELLQSFQDGIDLTRILRLPFITLRTGNRLRRGIDFFFSHMERPQYILECDQSELVYELAKSGAGAGLLSPVVFYQHINEETSSSSLHVFPVRNKIPESTVSLAYRKGYPLPQYAMSFIQDTCLVFRGYAHTINHHFTC